MADVPILTPGVGAAVGQEFRASTAREAVRCHPVEGDRLREMCGIAGDGLFIHLDSLTRTNTGYTAIVTYSVTQARGPRSSATCGRTLALTFVPGTTDWQLKKKEVTMTC